MGLEKVSFHSNPKERQCQRMCKLPYNYVHFTCSKVMLKILQLVFSSLWTENFQMFRLGFKKAEDQRSNCQHLLDHGKSKRVPEKHLFLLYWLFQGFDCVDHNKLWTILKEMGIPDHLTCLLRNLYAGQNSWNWTWNNRLVPNRKRSRSRQYIVTLLI